MTEERLGGDPACWAHVVDDATIATAPESQLLRFLRVAADTVVVCDRAGTITFWNTAAEDLFGWPAAEAVGRALDLIIPERFRERHWIGWRAAVERGSSPYTAKLLEVPALTRAGTTISIAASMTLLLDHRGAVEGIATIIREDRSRQR